MRPSKSIAVQIVNAFTNNNKGGNPAGVVLDADELSKEQKLAIAAKVGLSETAFVSKSDIADIKLDFFTPNRQIAHCGHATIATFSYLAQLGKINNTHSSKETVDGRREILLVDDLAFMEQTAPKYQNVDARTKDFLSALSLKSTDLLDNFPIQVVNTGNSFALIPVKDSETLANLTPDFDRISQLSEDYDLIGFYVFTTNTNHPERAVETRMFGPRYDILEEAGTGMAAGPLACYLYDTMGMQQAQFLIHQGHFMAVPSPSLIVVDLFFEQDNIVRLMAGGKGMVSQKMLVEIG